MDARLSGQTLYGVPRCPHCGVAKPLLTLLGNIQDHHRGRYEEVYRYFSVNCSACRHVILCYGHSNKNMTVIELDQMYPPQHTVSEHVPERPRTFLLQAISSLHAPDGAVMLSCSAVDAMLKEKGYTKGDLYPRIEQAHNDNLLTRDMKDWSHEIRLTANESRHADDMLPPINDSDAVQCVEFAKALAEYLYVLPASVTRWKAKNIKPALNQ